MLSPDPLSLSYGHWHRPWAAPAIVPHPDVHLVEPAAVALIPLCVCRGASKTPIVIEAVLNCRVTVAADETLNEGEAPQHVSNRADVEAGQEQVAGLVIECGHLSPLHDAVLLQIDRLKCAEVH
jgi:hypothetical protein